VLREREEILAAVEARDARALVALATVDPHWCSDAALTVLARLGSIAVPEFAREDDPRVETASLWRSGADFFLLFQPRFVREHVRTAECLTFVVLHEVMHRLMGDLRRPAPEGFEAGEVEDLRGIAADLLVNATLRRHVVAPSPPLLARLYGRLPLPGALLRPPEQVLRRARMPYRMVADERHAVIERTFGGGPVAAEAAKIWHEAHFGEPSYDAILTRLAQLFPEWRRPPEMVLLGTHRRDEDNDPWMAWLRHELGGLLPGISDRVQETRTRVVPRECRELFEAVRRALCPDRGTTTRPKLEPEQGVVPTIGRREAFLLGAGLVPVLWPTPLVARRPDEERATIYVDVSASVNEVLPFLFGLVAHLGDVAGRVLQFSNVVAPLDPDALREGRVHTTGGTDFDCIARHALSTRRRRIVVLTDGMASLSAPLERALAARVEVFVLLTEDADYCPLLPLAGGPAARGRRWWVLPRSAISGADDAPFQPARSASGQRSRGTSARNARASDPPSTCRQVRSSGAGSC